MSSVDTLLWPILAHLRNFAHYLVPPIYQRIEFTLSTAKYAYAPILCTFIMAGLARQPNTGLLRLAFLPASIIIVIRCSFAYYFDEDQDINNHGLNHINGR